MIAKITSGGASFKGAFLYYMHDKDADTRERVAWTRVENMSTECADKAWRIMAYTAREQERLKEAAGQSRAGRKLEKPVFAFSLSWHPEQLPTPEHMTDTARQAIDMLGLSDHQAVIIAHDDEPQKHVHVIVNRVHPVTGLAGDVRNSKRKFSDFAREYERTHGKIYCARREQNHARRSQGDMTVYSEPSIEDAWNATASGTDFKAALEARGFALAQGRKRLVVVDPHGKVHNPTRLLKDVRAADIKRRLADVDLSLLPDADEAAAAVKRKPAPEKRASEERESAPAQVDKPEAAPASKAETEPQKPEASSAPKRDPAPEPETPQPRDERSAFEELAAQQTDELRERQRGELRRTREQMRERFVAAKKRLVAYHDLPERKAALLRLREKIETAPWWKRLIGITGRDRKRMAEDLQSYRQAVSHSRESLAHVRAQAHDALNELTHRQAEERTRLEANIARLRERNGLFRGKDERGQSRSAGPLRERDPEGPSLGL